MGKTISVKKIIKKYVFTHVVTIYAHMIFSYFSTNIKMTPRGDTCTIIKKSFKIKIFCCQSSLHDVLQHIK